MSGLAKIHRRERAPTPGREGGPNSDDAADIKFPPSISAIPVIS